MGEFATMGGDTSIPSTGSSTYENALGLTNPDNILTGTQRGQQALGAPNIKTDSANQRIVVNDNNVNRVSFGKIGTGVNDWGLKVSKPTINVDTATADQLVFNSAQNVFKIVTKLSVPFSISAGGTGGIGSFSASHNLGYQPFTIGSITITSGTWGTGNYPLPYLVPSLTTFGSPAIYQGAIAASISFSGVDTSTFSFSWVLQQNSSITGSATLYVLQETLT